MDRADMMAAAWRKSTFSEAGNCVEVADLDGQVLVRDTKLSALSSVLSFPSFQWQNFIASMNKF
jgi:hypothetical protein